MKEKTVQTLPTEFGYAVQNVTMDEIKRERAIEAHTEVRELLENDPELCSWGISTRLIGSYARHTARYPGKDVDVFLRFTGLTIRSNPKVVYEAVARVLVDKYGEKDVDPGGRVTRQPRSLKIVFTNPDEPDENLSFSIDAVPAVPWGEHWGIPNRDTTRWASQTPEDRWIKTNPIQFADDSEALSVSTTSPTVGTINAYCPVVRLLRQVRHVHLGDARPGGLFVEVLAYYAWKNNKVKGSSWAELLTSTLAAVAAGCADAAQTGLPDPVLRTAMKPELSPQQWLHAVSVFERLARQAQQALDAEKCQAAKLWRDLLGSNDRGQILPLPAGCDANGFPIASVASVAAVGSDEPRGFA